MSEIPDTDNVEIAMIATAWDLTSRTPEAGKVGETFEKRLERFKQAYEAVSEAVYEQRDKRTKAGSK